VGESLLEYALSHVRRGAERAGKRLQDLYICVLTAFHVAKPGEELAEMQRAVGAYVTSECNIFALSVKDPNDLPANIRDDVMRFRDAYRTPDAPIETRHLDLYSGYVHEFKQEHAPLVNEKILKETTLCGTPEELVKRAKATRRSAEGESRFREVCDRQGLIASEPIPHLMSSARLGAKPETNVAVAQHR
jgi:alkanesulfonate monooxygenase SsuD/methylene tetrahydromethanopterin reductase-like flavin-dependent oxidoreductase (luciferase family)